MKLSVLKRFLCRIGVHRYGRWSSLMTESWRHCERCNHRDSINSSYM